MYSWSAECIPPCWNYSCHAESISALLIVLLPCWMYSFRVESAPALLIASMHSCFAECTLVLLNVLLWVQYEMNVSLPCRMHSCSAESATTLLECALVLLTVVLLYTPCYTSCNHYAPGLYRIALIYACAWTALITNDEKTQTIILLELPRLSRSWAMLVEQIEYFQVSRTSVLSLLKCAVVHRDSKTSTIGDFLRKPLPPSQPIL